MIKMKDNYVDVNNTKWWIKFLLLFKKSHFKSERCNKYICHITYKTLFGKIYLISDRLIGINLH